MKKSIAVTVMRVFIFIQKGGLYMNIHASGSRSIDLNIKEEGNMRNFMERAGRASGAYYQKLAAGSADTCPSAQFQKTVARV